MKVLHTRVINCTVARLQIHIDTFSKLATYSTSVVKSKIWEGYQSLYTPCVHPWPFLVRQMLQRR